MTTPRITNGDSAILTFLAQDDGAYQFNTWAIQGEGIELFTLGRDLQSLKRRGLVDGEGRGRYRQWWITEAGKQALADGDRR